MNGVQSDRFYWNEALKADILIGAYLDLLGHLGGGAATGDFWGALPRPDRLHSDWRPFAEALYKEAVAEAALAVPSSSGSPPSLQWAPLDSLTYFPDDAELGPLLGAMGIRMVALDPLSFGPVRDALLAAGAALIGPAVVAELLRGGEASPAPAGSCLPCLLQDSAFARQAQRDEAKARAALLSLLDYLSQRPAHLTVDDRWALNLFGLPLKLTQDGRLDVFEDAVVFAEPADAAALFPRSGAAFLHPELVQALADVRNRLAAGCFQRLGLPDLPRLLRENLERKKFERKDERCLPLADADPAWLWGFWKLLLGLLAGLKLETDTKDLFVNRAKRALSALGDWKLVPVRQGGPEEEPDLAPLSLLRFIFAPGSEEEAVFRPLGVPVFCDDFRAGAGRLSSLSGWTSFRDLLAADFPTGIKALAHWNDRRTVDWEPVGPAVAPVRSVLEYIRAHANRIDSILSPLIARFPIFKSVEDVYARLDSPFPVYVFPEAEEVPAEGRAHWCQGVLFLARIPVYDQLYLRLSLPNIHLPSVVATYIIPTLPAMHIADRVAQLAFIAGLPDHPSFERTPPDAILERLRGLAFVSAKDGGRLFKVAAFHDPAVPIFAACLHEGDFLPEAFADPRIPAAFWRSLGLRTLPSPEQLLDFASRLAGDADWAQDGHEYEERLHCLLDAIRDNALDGEGAAAGYEDALAAISRLPLVPRDRRRSKYRALALGSQSPAGGSRDEEERIPIAGSVTPEHESLMWTTGPCLPAWLTDAALLKVLGAAAHPSVERVLAHARALLPPLWEAKLANETAKGVNSPKNVALLAGVVGDILAFLSEHLEEAAPLLPGIADVPLVLVEEGRRLAPPSMVVTRLPDFILHQRVAPFLYELPSAAHQWLDVLKLAGVREAAHPAAFARTLDLFLERGLDTANPNVAEAIMLAQKGLVHTLAGDEAPLSSLVLLGTDLRLHDSHLLVLRDKEVEQEIQLDDVVWCHPSEPMPALRAFLAALPIHLRPQLLSDVIAEEVDGELSRPCLAQPCAARQGLQARLQSAEFAEVLASIFGQEPGGGPSADVREEALGKVGRISVTCFHSLAAQLVHRHTGMPVSAASHPTTSLYSPEAECLSILHEGAAGAEAGRFMAGLAKALHAALPLASFESALLLQAALDWRRADPLPPPLPLASPTGELGPSGPRVGDRLGAGFMDHLLLSSLHFYSPGELVGYLRPTADGPLPFPPRTQRHDSYVLAAEEMLVILARVSSVVERNEEANPKAITQRYRLILEEKPHMTPKTVEATALVPPHIPNQFL